MEAKRKSCGRDRCVEGIGADIAGHLAAEGAAVVVNYPNATTELTQVNKKRS